MSKKSVSRVEAEAREGMEQVVNEVPENRLQTTQQIATTDSANDTKPKTSSFQAKRSEVKGSALKQQAIADAITGASDSTGMGINASGRSVSGTGGGILGAANSTPVAGKSRKDTRVGKKLDRIATKLNYTPCERYIVSLDESKPLAETKDEDQGYNGTYRNEDARSQKIAGSHPADPMFQRSVDYIFKDKLYFVEGQQIFQESSRSSINPTKTYDDKSKQYKNVSYVSGNYLHKSFHAGLNELGKVKFAFFEVDDITPRQQSAEEANVASAHRLIKENVAEIDRINMDAKAGDEKAEIWTPLARAIEEPTAASYLMSSIEADTGAYVHLAYSKATTNMSHQLNRAAKDGLDVITPGLEQCTGWRNVSNSNKSINSTYNNDIQNLFTMDNYRRGDPSLMIAAYDSERKYTTKADFILQPRGFRMHLQTADNNMNPLKCPKEYAQVFAGQETYSTIDQEYDGLTPLCITDKANLITVHNFNELSGFINIPKFKSTITSSDIDDYGYNVIKLLPAKFMKALNYENIYIYSKKTAGDGLVYSNGVISYDPDSSGGEKVNDVILRTSTLSTTDLATGGVYAGYVLIGTYTQAVNNTLGLVFHEPKTSETVTASDTIVSNDYTAVYNGAGEYAYKYSDLRNNYVVKVKHPLVEGLIQYLNESIGGKFRSLLKTDELYVPFIFSTQYMTLAQLMICAATPWIVRARQNSMKDVLYYEDNVHEYPYSKLASLKDVPFKNYVNFSYSGYDEAIESKVMNPVVAMQWEMPEFFWKVGSGKYVSPWYFNENELENSGKVNEDASAMSFPSIRSGKRLAFLDNFYSMSEKDVRLSLDRMTKSIFNDSVKFSGFKAYKYARNVDGQILCLLREGQDITLYDILACPRELGLCMDAPLGVLTKDPADSDSYKALNSNGISTSHRIKIYVNPETPEHPSELSERGVNISRAANYIQVWYELCANNATSYTDLAGLVFGLNDEDTGLFSPFAELGTGAQMENAPDIQSYQRAIWTRIQLLPYIISPFDANYNTARIYSHDIYDFAYYFGLAGFRASDYRESVYNREKEVINQGMLFVEDPWIIDSPIIKNGASSIGISITKGYELGK